MPSSPDSSFPASYDTATKLISLFVSILFFGIAALIHNAVVACVYAVGLFLAYAYSPSGYTIRQRSLIVKRLIGNVQIPLDDLREVRATTSDDLRGCLRLWGNGGLFGYYGLYRTSKLGRCTWYVTNRSRTVVLIAGEKTTLVSPGDVNGFLAAIGPSPAPGAVQSAPAEPRRSARLANILPKVFAGIVMAAGLTFGAFCIFYSPGFPSYTLTPNGLTIHDFFYPVTVEAASVDVGRIRTVDFDVDADWRVTGKTNGFANSHYQSGWFRVANGQKVRLYRANGTRLVLLPPKAGGAALLLEVKEPEKFLGDVQRRWGNRT
jgi:hypothetical protein